MQRGVLIDDCLALSAVWYRPLPQQALAWCPPYAHVEGYTGLMPLVDQHLGGSIMLFVGGPPYCCGGLWLTVCLLQHSVLEPKEPA
jgi:hypothetical protein